MSRSARRCSLIASNCPTDTDGERRVLRVGAEDPRVVRVAGADPGRLAHGAGGPGTACPGWSSGSAGRSRVWVRSAMFCLPHSTACCDQRVAGQRRAGSCRPARRGWRSSRRAAAAGLASVLASSPRALATPWSEPATASQTVFEPPAGSASVVGQPPAGARCRTVRRRRPTAWGRPARPARCRCSGDPAWAPQNWSPIAPDVGPQRRADERRVVVLRGAGQRAVVGEHEAPAVVAALVGQVVRWRWASRRRSPTGTGPSARSARRRTAWSSGPRRGWSTVRPKSAPRRAVGHEVGAPHLQPGGVGQVVAACSPSRW